MNVQFLTETMRANEIKIIVKDFSYEIWESMRVFLIHTRVWKMWFVCEVYNFFSCAILFTKYIYITIWFTHICRQIIIETINDSCRKKPNFPGCFFFADDVEMNFKLVQHKKKNNTKKIIYVELRNEKIIMKS